MALFSVEADSDFNPNEVRLVSISFFWELTCGGLLFCSWSSWVVHN